MQNFTKKAKRRSPQTSGGSRKFWWGGFEAKTSKIWMSSPKLRVIFWPKSEIQTFFSPKIRWSPKKKKKRSSPELRLILRPDSLRSGRWGDASRNGAKLFKIEADFSAKIVTFRLVGGDASPPKSATAPDPRASGSWGLCPQTPGLRQLEASPPDPNWPPAVVGSAPRPPKQPPPL